MRFNVLVSVAAAVLGLFAADRAAAQTNAETIDLELGIVRYRITAVRPSDPGYAEVDVRAAARNTRGASYSGVSAQFTPNPALPVTSTYPFLTFNDVGPNAIVASPETLTVRLPARLLPVFRRALIAGQAFTVDFTGTEVPVAAGVIRLLDVDTCSAYRGLDPSAPLPEPGGPATYLFSPTALVLSLQPGELLTEGGCLSCGVADIPWRIESVTAVGADVQVVATPISLGNLYENASFIVEPPDESFRNIGGPNTTNAVQIREAGPCEEGEVGADGIVRIEQPTGMFFRFNDVEVAPGVKLSGSFAIGSVSFRVEVRIRDGIVERAAVVAEVSEHLTVEAVAEATVDIPRHETVLLPPFRLPVFHVNVGGVPVEVTPELSVYVGAEGSITGGIVIGGVQSGAASFEAAAVNGVPSGAATFNLSPLQLTPPQITSETGMSARLFGGIELLLNIGHLGGPTATLEGFVDLTVDPDRTPWWELSVGGRSFAGLQFSPLGIDIAEVDFPAVETPHSALTAPESGDMTPAGRVAGLQQRWAKAYDLPANSADSANDVAIALDGSTLVAGNTLSRGYLMKLDRDGNPVFTKEFGNAAWAQAVVDVPGIGHFVAGDRGSDLWAAMIDPAGVVLWIQEYDLGGGIVDDIVLDRILDSESGAVTGLVLSGRLTVSPEIQGFVLKLSATGVVEWANTYNLPGAEQLYDISATTDGGFVASGYLTTVVPGIDDAGLQTGWVLKLAADGAVSWSSGAGSNNAGEELRSVAETTDGGFVAVGKTGKSAISPHEALLIVKLTSAGAASWLTTFAGPPDFGTEPAGPPVTGVTAQDTALGVIEQPYGFLVAGRTNFVDASSGWLMRMDDDGDVVWWHTMDGGRLDEFSSIANAGDGLVIAGISKSFMPVPVGGDQTVLVNRIPYDGQLHYAAGTTAFTNYSDPIVKHLTGSTLIGNLPITSGAAEVTPTVTPVVVTTTIPSWTVADVVVVPVELVQQ